MAVQIVSLGAWSSLEPTVISQELMESKGLASEGYVLDIYTAFMAYGWHYGRIFDGS